MTTTEGTQEEPVKYCTNLRASVETEINENPRAFVHSREWKKIMNGDPVEINPSVGHGLKIMTVDEWSCRWKRNEDFPDCLACGSLNTKEHHFIQVSILVLLVVKLSFSLLRTSFACASSVN